MEIYILVNSFDGGLMWKQHRTGSRLRRLNRLSRPVRCPLARQADAVSQSPEHVAGLLKPSSVLRRAGHRLGVSSDSALAISGRRFG